MKKYLPKGFTMIELLIVIAVLGVLAVAVLAAINPIEQINRGRDTGSRSDAEQLLSAIDRYNASQMLWPWQDTIDDSPSVTWGAVTAVYPTGKNCTMLKNLAKDTTEGASCPGTDEIKASFVNRILNSKYNPLFIEYQAGPGNSVYVCFSPQSGSFAKEAETRCTTEGGTPEDFPTAACDGTCDAGWCICLP